MTAAVWAAVDTVDLDAAVSLAAKLGRSVGGLKLGLEFFIANGVNGVREVAESGPGRPIFLDLKFHDIPTTVAGAVRAACAAYPAILNVHASGGRDMMKRAAEAAVDGAANHGGPPLKLIAVTVLTSMGRGDLADIGVGRAIEDQAREQALLARDCGLDGVVCSPREAAAIREACGPRFLLVTPGVRPPWAACDDQKRIMTPAEAVAAGSDILVVGRPITAAADPAAAAGRIVRELDPAAVAGGAETAGS